MRPASLLLTSMPGMRVFDAHVHIGCYHLPPLKVYHQLTLAGIEGATLLADPETLGLPCGYSCASEVADRWRHPRYLTKRGNCHSQKYPYPWLLPIPAIPLQHGCVSKSRRFSACDDLSPQCHVSLLTDGNERLTQGVRKRRCLTSSPGGVTGVHRRVLTRLLSIPTPMRNASGRSQTGRCRECRDSVVVVWCRLVVWRSGVQSDMLAPCTSPPGHVGALHWRAMSQLLQQSEVTQRR